MTMCLEQDPTPSFVADVGKLEQDPTPDFVVDIGKGEEDRYTHAPDQQQEAASE